jgi:hypothetical protein
MTFSETQRRILAAAAQHDARLAVAPHGLPTAARNAMFRSMIKHDLLSELPASQESLALAGGRMTQGRGLQRGLPARVCR